MNADAPTSALPETTNLQPLRRRPPLAGWEPYGFLLAPLGLMTVFFFIPVLMAVGMSLHDYGRNLNAPDFVGLANYGRLLSSPAFLSSLWNTTVFVLGIVPAMVTLPILMALVANGTLRGIGLFRALIYLPVIVSMVVVGLTWKWLYADDGLVNYGLSLVGLPKVGWLVNPDIALYAVMAVIIWKGLAYYMMMYIAHLQSVSQDLYEAATVDGANLWQRHWHVTLPHLRPAMAMVALISTIGSLKVFTEIYVMTRGGPVGATQTMVYYIFDQAFGNLDLGLATAAGLILMAILLVLSMIQMHWFGDREEAHS